MKTLVLPTGARASKFEIDQLIASAVSQRIADHQKAVHDRGDELGGPKGGLVLIAHGDSWFDYPINGAWGGFSDAIAVMNGRKGSPEEMQILNFAHWGAPLLGRSITEAKTVSAKGDPNAIGGDFMLGQVRHAIKDPKNGSFEGMLLSAGGNDFAGDQFAKFLNDAGDVGHDPQRALNQAFSDRMSDIKAGYEGLVRFRDAHLAGKPIFVNGYGNAIPDGRAVCQGSRAWLQPSFIERRWYDSTTKDLDTCTQIVRAVLTRFRDMVASLGNDVFLVDTSSVLATDDWANELHPDRHGFEKVAGALLDALRAWPAFKDRV
jgi:hypothetical protein